MSKCTHKIIGTYSKTEIENVISEWVTGNNAIRNREILCLRYIDGLTYEEIAEEVDVSYVTVKCVVSFWYPTIQRVLDERIFEQLQVQ